MKTFKFARLISYLFTLAIAITALSSGISPTPAFAQESAVSQTTLSSAANASNSNDQIVDQRMANPSASELNLPEGWSRANTGGPLCANEGYACRFNGDCCHGVCKNFQICDAGPILCVPARFQCNTDHDCCDGLCNQVTHECNAR